MTVNEIAEKIDAEVTGDGGITIRGIAKIEEADAGQISFISNPKYLKYLSTTNASAVIISNAITDESLPPRPNNPVLLRVADPYVSFLFVLRMFYSSPEVLPPGIHPTAIIPKSAELGTGARIGAHVVIGENSVIGAHSAIAHGTVLGDNVRIGDNTVLYPNVTVREGCRIGSEVIIHSGTVVGSDGFGFAPQPDGSYAKIPQTGIVVVEDNVEIGSNCSIDRATMGETRICRGVKLDNLIQVAHNVVIGENTVIAAQTGISGSTKIGKQCIIAGQVGIIGHIEITDKVTIAAQSGIAKTIKKEGTYFGYPAKEHSRALRIEAVIRQLPELMKDIEHLKKELDDLKDTMLKSNSSQ
jgi:UDP-3-O-[3-hydroxymyristoyl] glucosamine N-acyltransferase